MGNWKKSLKFHYVETLVFGEAVDRAIYPERIILGKFNNKIKIPKVLSRYIKKFYLIFTIIFNIQLNFPLPKKKSKIFSQSDMTIYTKI